MRFDRGAVRWQKGSKEDHGQERPKKRSQQGCMGGQMPNSQAAPRALRSGALKYAAVFAVFSLACPVSAASAQTADTVLFNGKIVTVDKDFSVREALAIANGKVLASGSSGAM